MSRSWTSLTVAVAALVVLPVLVVGASLLDPAEDVWRHLAGTRLPTMLFDTTALLLMVAVGTLVLGAGLAWLTAAYEFPGRRALSWLLVLPLAMPAYVLGFVFLSVFGFTGPLQGALRSLFGADVWVPEVRSLGGAAVVLSLTLYPYVYLLARAALREQAALSYDVARTLGQGPLAAARRVVLPLARPSLAAGSALVMMEVLTDFATVQYFNVQTVSVGVFRIWKGMFDRDAASELAALVLLFALAVLAVERLLRGRRRYDQPGGQSPGVARIQLDGARGWAATGACLGVLLVAFIAPVGQLVAWSGAETVLGTSGFDVRYVTYLGNSSLLAAITAGVAVSVATAVANAARFTSTRIVGAGVRLSTVGYAVPGPVIAIGVLVVLAGVDAGLAAVGLPTPGLVVTGSMVGLVYAYAVRFLALGVQSVDASLAKIPLDLTDSARTLGARPVRVLWRIHRPLLRSGLAVGLLLVGVEALKELPIVLLLRPFGFETLSVWVWQLASDSRWEAAALPALTIVAASLIPVGMLFRQLIGEEQPHEDTAPDPRHAPVEVHA